MGLGGHWLQRRLDVRDAHIPGDWDPKSGSSCEGLKMWWNRIGLGGHWLQRRLVTWTRRRVVRRDHRYSPSNLMREMTIQ